MQNYYKNRLIVANLIEEVLLEKKTVSMALSEFPKDLQDINVKCAFDALLHREADEDLRAKIKDYSQAQDDYLLEIAKILRENKTLPQNVIQRYLKFHKDDVISHDDGSFKSALEKVKRMINF